MRLVAFGCSNTFGQALPDVWDEKLSKPIDFELGPSKFAWPQILANKLNIECINLGYTGVSNKEIWWNIINYDFQKTDIVIIFWSWFDRTCIIEKDNLTRIGNWEQKHKIFFTTYHNEFDQRIQFFLYCNHVHHLLHNILKLLKYYTNMDPFSLYSIKKYIGFDFINRYIKVLTNDPLEHFGKAGLLYDKKAMDNVHSGLEAHEAFATAIYNEMKDEIT